MATLSMPLNASRPWNASMISFRIACLPALASRLLPFGILAVISFTLGASYPSWVSRVLTFTFVALKFASSLSSIWSADKNLSLNSASSASISKSISASIASATSSAASVSFAFTSGFEVSRVSSI